MNIVTSDNYKLDGHKFVTFYRKSRYNILLKLAAFSIAFSACFLFLGASFGANTEESELKNEYKQELNRIASLGKKLDVTELETLAGSIDNKWRGKNKEYYAQLMLRLCALLNTGQFDTDRQIELSRKYALMGFKFADKLEIRTELDLVLNMITDTIFPNSPKGENFAEHRRGDVIARLHVWKRLRDAIDPAWDPNDLPRKSVLPPESTHMGLSDTQLKKLREEYKVEVVRNHKKAETYNKQSDARKWLKGFAPRAEKYIVKMYSRPPYDSKELEKYLTQYGMDTETKTRIMGAVKKNTGGR